jgi:hypothetical protein
VNLAQLQRAFFARIAQVGEADPRLEEEVRTFGALTAAERLDLYANMYFVRLVEALRADFPCVALHLGDEAFEAQVAGYVRAHPSTHPSLDALGRHFEAHLRANADLDAEVADLAALENARAEVRTAADAEPVTKDALAALGPERFGAARLTLIPALRVLSLARDVGPLWQRLEDAGASTGSGRPSTALGRNQGAPEMKQGALGLHANAWVVWRRDFEVFHAPISSEEAQALRLAREGRTVAELCAPFESLEEPVLAAFAALASWMTEGMVARVDG